MKNTILSSLIIFMSILSINLNAQNFETASFGGGCFWCVEAIFEKLNGIESVVSGYSGGKSENPSYEEVISGTTNHAESIQLKFDSSLISYQDILEIFFYTHDPTTLNRQGNDFGTQYRSIIFYHSKEQKEIAVNTIHKLELENAFSKPLVTEIVEFENFYQAEDYHQDYYENNKEQPYCKYVIAPKLEKLIKKYSSKLK